MKFRRFAGAVLTYYFLFEYAESYWLKSSQFVTQCTFQPGASLRSFHGAIKADKMRLVEFLSHKVSKLFSQTYHLIKTTRPNQNENQKERESEPGEPEN